MDTTATIEPPECSSAGSAARTVLTTPRNVTSYERSKSSAESSSKAPARALLCEQSRRGEADAAARAGEDDAPAVERGGHRRGLPPSHGERRPPSDAASSVTGRLRCLPRSR